MSHEWQFPDADRFMRGEMARDGSYQGVNLAVALTHVTEWACAVDLGAHVGTWSRLLSARFQRVIAAEPSLDTFACLEANMLGFGCANVECLNVAVGAAPGMVSMALIAKEVQRGNTGARYVQDGGSIPRVTVDSWKLDGVGFLKIDVEGSELQCLQGAAETLQRCKPIVLFEAKGFAVKRYGEARDAVPRWLLAAGYRPIMRVNADHIWGAA